MDADNVTLLHHINQAIKARGVMTRDVDYVVKDDQVIIVDEFTGRLMFGRRYNEGLHQAIEAKAVSYTHLIADRTLLIGHRPGRHSLRGLAGGVLFPAEQIREQKKQHRTGNQQQNDEHRKRHQQDILTIFLLFGRLRRFFG